MAAVASPTPLTFGTGSVEARRLGSRMPIRSTTNRYQMRAAPDNSALRRSYIQQNTNDSSDDEDLAPIKLSAEAQAILGEDNLNSGADKENVHPRINGNYSHGSVHEREISPDVAAARHSPVREDGSPAPRVVRVHASRPSPRTTLARDGSFMYKIHEKSGTTSKTANETKTPAPQLRRIRVSGSRSQTASPPSAHSSNRPNNSNEQAPKEYFSPEYEPHNEKPEDDLGAVHPSTIMRPRRGEEQGIHSTMRHRRIGMGTLLNGPVRRGMIRRQSEEDEGQLGYKAEDQDSPEVQQGRRAQEPELEDLPDEMPISYGSPRRQGKSQDKQFASPDRAPLQPSSAFVHHTKSEPSSIEQHVLPTPLEQAKPTPASHNSCMSSKSSTSGRKPIFKIPSLPPLESSHDQENEPPPTFKRSKPSAALLEVHEDQSIESDKKPQRRPTEVPSTTSPSRAPLAPRSNNTPHRPAPAPPPKMSLIEAATSSAGNARSKKSVHYVLNGRTYRRLDCIGRGGSSRVFRIMAENYKIFALKRVNLEEADMAAIAGYKGEIDLLQKLSNVDRVVRLFDYEVNEDKGVLNVMMELGESDFNKMLNEQLKGENAKLDITFTRHYWKEMLECVRAVHLHDIVHSDLKPANFLLVKGQLKLIDFGIANAIQDDTVNVHRENQIGTPNYMSPESLVCHTPAPGTTNGPKKILKLGKPSDIWSLGCILYQMTYGQPPFAHITKQFERIMSIPNPKVEIKFPSLGIGGAVVPFGLIKTLRRCLQRDASLRPTVEELLSEKDPFLCPVAISPEMLGRVIGNVVGYCRKREETLKREGRIVVVRRDGESEEDVQNMSCLPRDEEMRGWPGAFYEKLRQAMEEGSAW